MSAALEIRGRTVQMSDDQNTDVLHPSRFYSLDGATVKAGLRVGSEGEAEEARASIIVGGRNFGYGSSRETTLQALRANGFELVIATTISRIFWRNAVNAGLWVLEAGPAVETLRAAEELLVQPELGRIRRADGSGELRVEPPDAYDLAVLRAGGLLPWLRSATQAL